MPSFAKTPRWVKGLGLAAVVLAGCAVFDALVQPDLQDFVEYWSAGRLNAAGQNPYDPELVYGLERQVSPHLTDAIMMWNPPWTLPLVMPFGLLPVRVAHALWLAVNLLLILRCGDFLWQYFGGSAERRWVGRAVSLAFAPSLFALRMGQISPIVLLGVTGFLYFHRRQKWAWAGAALVLATIKPHIVLLFGIALVLEAVKERRWGLFGGALACGGLLTSIALLANPAAVSQYRYALAHQPPQFLSPTLGALLRLAFGVDRLWLQFIPTVIGTFALAVYWYRRRERWDWREEAARLLPVSFLCASYGAWPFDLVVLLVPVVSMTCVVARDGRLSTVAYGLLALAGFDVMALLFMDIRYTDQFWHVWMTPTVLYCYVVLRRMPSQAIELGPCLTSLATPLVET